MSVLGHIVLIGWAPVALVLFALLPPRRAVITAYLVAWLFLPMAGYGFVGWPDYTKVTATSLSVVLGVAIFDIDRLLAFRPRLMDLPMLVWCLCPVATSLSNGLGIYDGLSGFLAHALAWGVPYLMGRLYFRDPAGRRDLVVGLLIGGLVYVPLCLYEIRMSPQLHSTLYGFHQHSWMQTKRFGGWRPTVFLQHGLMVGMWMTVATVAGFALWHQGVLKRLWGVPAWALVLCMSVTTVLCKSSGAIALLLVGIGALLLIKQFRSVLPLLCLLALSPGHMVGRTLGLWTGDPLVRLAEATVPDRAGSLKGRLLSERLLADRAMERPLFGWGGFGRSLVRGATPDGLWALEFGKYGLVGLVSLTSLFILPVAAFASRKTGGRLALPSCAPSTALCVILSIYSLDCLLNAMVNPIYTVAAGALAGAASLAPQASALRQQTVAPRHMEAQAARGLGDPVPDATLPCTRAARG